MPITINGKQHSLGESRTLQSLLQKHCPEQKRVVAELNGSIIKRDHWPQTEVKDGDVLELVTFVGGG
ncbi:MAG: sulfur carrier protein ThiS [Candidatus Omnitrophota bacterium]